MKLKEITLAGILILLVPGISRAKEPEVVRLMAPLATLNASDIVPPKWDLATLAKAPATTEAQEAKVAGLQSLFIAGLPFKGRATKFYAYLGFPANRAGKVPAVVLVHGGGGTAMAGWVKYWNAKGYVALAMDNEGQVPVDLNKDVLTSGTASHKTQ